MNRRRFSDQQLRYLRNQIPIEALIPTVIRSANTTDRQCPRFDCPLCGSHDTAINKTTNLARCFSCRKNFNPIELVMAAKRMRFVDAVTLLLGQCNQPLENLAKHGPASGNRSCSALGSNTSNQSNPTALGQIIPSVLKTIMPSKPQESCCDGCKRLETRLAAAEQRLARIESFVAK